LSCAAQHFPQATQIVDLHHAREHLHELARLLEFSRAARCGSRGRRSLGPCRDTVEENVDASEKLVPVVVIAKL
jgi:hypothetical protein